MAFAMVRFMGDENQVTFIIGINLYGIDSICDLCRFSSGF